MAEKRTPPSLVGQAAINAFNVQQFNQLIGLLTPLTAALTKIAMTLATPGAVVLYDAIGNEIGSTLVAELKELILLNRALVLQQPLAPTDALTIAAEDKLWA